MAEVKQAQWVVHFVMQRKFQNDVAYSWTTGKVW